jgi:hypothetical protein
VWNNGEKKSQKGRGRVEGIVTVRCGIMERGRAKNGGEWLEEEYW